MSMKAVVIKKYDNGPMAYVDAEKLRSEGVDCEVIGESAYSTVIPGSFRLVVLEDVSEKAKELLGL